MTRLTATVIVVMSLVGASLWAKGHSQAAAPAGVSACSLTEKGQFAVGAIHVVKSYYYGADATYRCLPIVDANLKPNGAAWVKVQADGTIGLQLPQ